LINYSLSQKFLHKICLSNNFVKKISFEFDNFFIKNKDLSIKNNQHVFITGLARSGTTAILNFFYEQNIFASLTYNDMPFILAPKISNILNKNNIDKKFIRLHKDGIVYKYSSPEALDEIFWKTYNDEEVSDYLSKYIYQILKKYKKSRYLSKNNYNYKRINKIKSIFPNSYFVITYRNPLQQAYSLFNQHKNFIQMQTQDKFILDYMNWLGHTEFGLGYKNWYKPILYHNSMKIDHWLEQWYLFYSNLLKNISNFDKLILLSYEDLCDNDDTSIYLTKKLNLNTVLDRPYFISNNKTITSTFDKQLMVKSNKIYEKMQDSSKNILRSYT
jgi:hypothetical protein